MKKFLFCIAALSLVFAAGTAMAWDADDHIVVAPNSRGDLIVFPVVLGTSSPVIKTKIVVTNTSEVECAVAKVVFRDHKYSQELLDFLIYLTPTDVWWGEIYYNAADGTVRVFSTDGSGPSSTTGVTFASVDYPLDQPFTPVPCAPGAEEIVYCEVFGTYTNTLINADGFNRPILKTDLKTSFETAAESAFVGHFAGLWDCNNILTGHYESYISGFFTGANRALVFADYDNISKLNVMNPTVLGESARNSLCEIEAALSKTMVSMPYYNLPSNGKFAVHWHTFITKLTSINTTTCNIVGIEGPYWNYPSGAAWIDAYWCVIYSPLYFDLEENAPGTTHTPFSPYTPPPDETFCWEVNWKFTIPTFISSNYEEGWVRYGFTGTTSCNVAAFPLTPPELSYTGAPDIPTVWFINTAEGLDIFDAAFINGDVAYNGNLDPAGSYAGPLPYYQYSDFVLPLP